MLIDRGANCNEFNDNGSSPLTTSCEMGHTQIVNLLLDKGADLNKCDFDVMSPVMIACQLGSNYC